MRATELVGLTRVRRLAESGDARRLREQAGLSLSEIASALGVSPAAVSRWERRERVPRGRVALRYGDLLDRLHDLGDE